MAPDLEGYERAYRLRSSADDDLLRQVFGQSDLAGLTKANPTLLETARSYFPHLTASTYERLAREPEQLRVERDRCSHEMEQLAVQNYGVFIGSAKVAENVRQELVDAQEHLSKVAETLAPVQAGIEEFQAAAAKLGVRRSALRNVLQQHGTLLELLELPQLLDACIRNQMFDESLELLAHCNTLLASANEEEIVVLSCLREQVSVQRANLHSSLVAQLKMDIHIPQCVRVIGFLRRIQRHSEEELRSIFIEHRGAFLEGHKQQVELLRGSAGSRGSVVTALKNAADLLRTHVYDIGTQYKALFPQDDAPLAIWLSEQIMWLVTLVRIHVLPPPATDDKRVQSQTRRGDSAVAAAAAVTGTRIDAANLTMILRQCWHASSTLKRLGGHFFPAVLGIFELRMERHVCEMLDIALLTFHAELGRYDWIPSTALAGGGGITPGGTGTNPAASNASAWLHPQALDLTRHRPLAVFTNDLFQVFIELRQCILYGIRAKIVTHFEECLTGAVNQLRAVRNSQALQTGVAAKVTEFTRLCRHFIHILVPVVAAHLEAVFGTAARLEASTYVAQMVPDLLPQSEVEGECPPPDVDNADDATMAEHMEMEDGAVVAETQAAAEDGVDSAMEAAKEVSAEPAPEGGRTTVTNGAEVTPPALEVSPPVTGGYPPLPGADSAGTTAS